MTYQIKLLGHREIAAGTTSFFFEKPAGFNFKAGQYCDFTLVNPPETDAEGNTRTFSIASAPFEECIEIATRMRDTAFKRVLGSLAIGAPIKAEGPMGSMTLQNDASRPAALLAGGIGITPFRSMVAQAAHDKLPHEIYLFYSNRRPEDAAFLEELANLQKQNPKFHFVPTFTGASLPAADSPETGYINGDMLKKYLPDVAKPIYYLAGSLAMVTDMRNMLDQMGIDSDWIKAEEFAGY